MAALSLDAGDQIALLGFDAPAAEMLSTLVTGALAPEAGRVEVLGADTAALQTSDQWLALVDRIGIVTERAVLLDPLTAIQNLAMPFSLSIDPVAPDVRPRAEALAAESGLPPALWERPVGDLDGEQRTRVRLGRALALDPALLLLEHPTAQVERSAVVALGQHVRAIAERRRLATLTITADEPFARAVAGVVLTWNPADGSIARSKKRGWLSWG